MEIIPNLIKYYLLSITILLFSICTSYSQNITEAIKLKEDSIQKYNEGEYSAGDTIVDLDNRFYEEYCWDESMEENKTKISLRQAALFSNSDGTKTLGISVNFWDFVCWTTTTTFYQIKDSNISPIKLYNILPKLSYKDFTNDTAVFSILKTYIAKSEMAEEENFYY